MSLHRTILDHVVLDADATTLNRIARWLQIGSPECMPRAQLVERIAFRLDPWLTIDDLRTLYPTRFPRPLHLAIPRDSRPHSIQEAP